MANKLKFYNFTSAIDVGFWQVLAKKKLEEIKLQDDFIGIFGYYSPSQHQDLPPLFHVVPDSLIAIESNIPHGSIKANGYLKIFNTLEEFKNADREKLLAEAGKNVLTDGNQNAFILIVYADLKSYVFYYWIAFPMINFEPVEYSIHPLADHFDADKLKEALAAKLQRGENLSAFLGLKRNDEGYELLNGPSDIICFIDPAPKHDFPGAPLRNILSYISQSHSRSIDVVAIKDLISSNPNNFSLGNSQYYQITLPEINEVKFLGWELNAKGKLGPRVVDLRPQLDPLILAQSAVDLNLKLMRWRMLPELNLDIISEKSCLLLGSGTLGCQVSRNLMAWGVKKITFVDSGKVSHSNPVRQSLFDFEDARLAKLKAIAAADNLKRIYPGVDAEGIQLEIPMPGHSIAGKEAFVKEQFEKLEALIRSHDIVFLLTDTRESRWVPTLITTALDKTCISVGLGFDSFVVVRHGGTPFVENSERLGCYFCNDVVGPRNSTNDRTLDQMCTVTRPGLSFLASSFAVELLISLLHHPEVHKAPHNSETPLGILPHQLRGNFGGFSIMNYYGTAFSKCTGCGTTVVSEYLEKGFDFVANACNDPDFLEEICGLKSLDSLNEGDLIEID
ncbi:ATG7 [Blepharisma stoltei]|uniref:Ubiquitin-like modifier-activating enzyme ATG7 n=1 Tax=Blepharisma stoltei TaxID=1481888 RepID=A0AAU9IS13_9CILI|nr:unnamed protein product [Blepharisma stoltei]